MEPIRRWHYDPVAGMLETCNLATHANTGKHAFDLLTPVGLNRLTTLQSFELLSPYCPTLGLNRTKFPEGFSCHQS